MRLQGRGGDNDPLGLTDQSALLLQSESLLGARSGPLAPVQRVQPYAVSSGTGFKVVSEVRFYILPNTYMGSLMTDGRGNYEGRLPVPAGIPDGTYTLQANGYAPSSAVRSLSLGVVVKSISPTRGATRAQATVWFAPKSAWLSGKAQAVLKELGKERTRAGSRVVSIGFVQRSGTTANDASLSLARARAVAAYLHRIGVLGKYSVKGAGIGGDSADARKVDVTVTSP